MPILLLLSMCVWFRRFVFVGVVDFILFFQWNCHSTVTALEIIYDKFFANCQFIEKGKDLFMCLFCLRLSVFNYNFFLPLRVKALQFRLSVSIQAFTIKYP